MNKRIIIGSGLLVSGLIVGGLTFADSKAEVWQPSPDITSEVQHQGEVLDNHEARITNTENDVKALQTKTNTPPNITRVEVPVPTTTAPPTQPAPEPQPVIVTSYEQIPIENSEDVDCKYTYSDGTTYQWHWQTVEYNQGTKITHQSNYCDKSTLGSIRKQPYP